MKSNRDAALKWAEFAWNEKLRGRRESASGPGSSLERTRTVQEFLKTCIRDFRIPSVLDLGCGDWNWMQQVFLSPEARDLTYAGWDIHPAMIAELENRYGSAKIRFKVADIFTEPLPEVDMVICRDVLFHVDLEIATDLVRKIMDSSARFFMSTTFPDEPRNTNIAPYLPIDGWGFHRINLDVEPFNLGQMAIRRTLEPGCNHNGIDRYVCLYAVTKAGCDAAARHSR